MSNLRENLSSVINSQELQTRSSSAEVPIIDGEKDYLYAAAEKLRKYYITTPKKQPTSIVSPSGEHAVIAVINQSSQRTKFISNRFYLTALNQKKNEKAQILETFGEPSVTFFGERVKIYEGAGKLLEANSSNETFPQKYRWASSMQKFYDDELRGTKLKKNNNIAALYVGNYILYGYFLNMVMMSSGEVPNSKQFSFSFLVKEEISLYTSELEVLYDIFKQLTFGNREAVLQILNQLEAARSELEEVRRDINFASQALAGNDNPALTQFLNEAELISRINNLEKELLALYSRNINEEFLG